MPIYEYRCAKCGDFEEMQKMSDKPLQRCPKCRRKVTKLMSSTSFQLKGSGWYASDYGKKSSKGTDTNAADKPDSSDKKTEKTEKKEKKDSSSKESSTPKATAAA